MSLPISGFTAVPNPMMLSFLATQGFAIMYYGGAGWQFGKRKVSGMSNEQVNKLSPNDFLMQLHNETRTMVPTMAQGMKDMTPLVKTTLELFGSYIREAIKAFPQVVQNILGSTDSGEFSNIPTSSGSSGNLPPQMASFLHYFATLSKATQGQIVAEAEVSISDTNFGDQTPGGFSADKVKVRFEGKLMTVKDRETILRLRRDRLSKEQKLFPSDLTKLTIPKAPLVKKLANQSARMERDRLIKSIATAAAELRSTASRAYRTSNQLSLIDQQRDVRKAAAYLKSQQQLLVNLLQRFRF